jgi:Rps23 Pro-64 3,4-dihydroxylase Tpa1-like proline 4-hydroxylase
MNSDLLRNNYLVVPNFITPEHAEKLRTEFHLTDSKFKFSGDPQAPNSAAVWNYLPALELLANKTSHVSEIVGETVLPTYVYSRIYRNGSVLTKHTDRPACEVSMTLHLGGDKPWAIWIETPEREKRCVSLNPGDAMLYLGCIAPHWRDKFDGEHYTQFFLHYVRSRGYCGEAYFDRERDLDEDFDILREEYEEMKNRFTGSSNNVILPKKYREEKENRFKRRELRSREKENLEIVELQDDDKEFVDFDEVIVANKKYEKFLTKKDSPELIAKPEKKGGLSQKTLEDFVVHLEEAIDPDFCDQILEQYVYTNYWEPTLTGNGHDPGARKCAFIPISDPAVLQEDNQEERKEIDNKLFEIVQDLIKQYQDMHPDFDLEIQEDSGYELLRYEEGDFYVQHTDSFKEQPRALTIIMSMNNGFEGGQVALFDRELMYSLDCGDVLMFPSNFMYPHEILPVKSGVRFSIITWVV